ncbi:MAG: hypothetical protein GY838_11535 [bacterium]|nr:hypothetical protein [bacterium]
MIRRTTILMILAALGLMAGTASAFFENAPVSARQRAMGESGAAVMDGAWSVFLNPAQLAETDGGRAGVSYVQPFGLDFADRVTMAVGLPFDSRYGRFGVGWSHFNVSHQDTTLLKENRFTFAHGLTLFEDMHSKVSFGWSGNVYSVDAGLSQGEIDPGSDAAFSFDAGLLLTVHRRTRIGVLVNNLTGPRIGEDREELPRRLITAIAYEPYAGVVTTFEFRNELDRDVQYRGGVEANVLDDFFLRAGIVTDPNRVSAGFGYGRQGFTLNYGFSTGGGTLDSTHQFGLSFDWGGEAQ